MFSFKKVVLIVNLALFSIAPIEASYLNEVGTVYLVEPNLAGLEFYQKMYFVNKNQVIFVREQSLYLSLARDIELGIKVPYLNNVQREISFNRLGDVKFHLNFGTDWFKSFAKINFFLEHNIGGGPKFDEISTHSMESYGFWEWRLGLIFFKKLKYFSIHANFFYVLRGQGERTIFDAFFDGNTLNIFDKVAYERGLGFNPANKDAFFARENLANDNLEYLVGFNSELSYPFVPFIELTFSHDFRGPAYKTYPHRAPGSGYFRSLISLGAKYFLSDDHFTLKISFIIPYGELSETFVWGSGLGVRLDF